MERWQAENFRRLGAKDIAGFVFREGVLKYGLPLTVLVQLLAYFVKYGPTTAKLGEFAAPMNIFLFTLTVLFEGTLFAWMIRQWSEPQKSRATLLVLPRAGEPKIGNGECV